MCCRGELASSDNVLEELFTGDQGVESPNPANQYMFQKVDSKGMVDFILETGRPYVWAQELAGLKFPHISVFQVIIVLLFYYPLIIHV